MKALVIIATALLAATMAVAAFALPPREYGLEEYRPKADCPQEPCRATGRTTGYQVTQARTSEGERLRQFPTRVRKRNGWLVGFSLTLGKPDDSQKRFFNRLWGKPAQARISILDPEPGRRDRKNRRQRYRLHNQSERIDLRPFFGKKAWFTLKRRIHVSKGQVIALTLPTWAPVLATGLPTQERWRSSRPRRDCDSPARPTAQQDVDKVRKYRCLHTTARLLFTALVIHKTPEN